MLFRSPLFYPGWQGHVEWEVEWPEEFGHCYIGSDLFGGFGHSGRRQRAHTGTGGGGATVFSKEFQCHVQKPGYDFRLYAADWPGLARYHEKRRVWNAISDGKEFA